MTDGGAGGGGRTPAAPTRVDAPAEYSFLTVEAITEVCNNFEEVIKGQSNRELLSDFNNLIGSEMTLTLGPELGEPLGGRLGEPRWTADDHRHCVSEQESSG